MTPKQSKYKLKSQKGGTLVELAMTAPFLILLLTGVLGLGDLITQQPWLSHSAYQLAEVLATTPEETGPASMFLRGTQISDERTALFQRLHLQMEPHPIFGEQYYGNLSGSGLRVAGVRFDVTLKTLWGSSIPTPMSIEVIAPQIVKKPFVEGLNQFQDPPELYDCCGIKCPPNGAGSCTAGMPNSCDQGSTASPLCGLIP